jgi:hypothetical protein
MAEMPGRDRAVVTALTLPLLTTYGYPLSWEAPMPLTTARLETRTTT